MKVKEVDLYSSSPSMCFGLGLVLHMSVVLINCCLGFFVSSVGCSYIWYEPSEWLGSLVFCTSEVVSLEDLQYDL